MSPLPPLSTPLECPPIRRMVADIAGIEASADIRHHLDHCRTCAERIDAVLGRASVLFAATSTMDCDEVMLAVAYGDAAADDGAAAADDDASDDELADLLVHCVDCEDCRALVLESTPDDALHALEDGQGPAISAVGDAVPVALPAASSTSSSADLPRLPLANRQMFTWGAELARGGMGRVSRVRDRRLGRELVVKEPLLRPGQSWIERQMMYARFEREARITARLNHPSIVAVHEAGRWPTGRPFYAMRHVAGIALNEAIAARTTMEARLELLPNIIAATEAIAYVHTRGIVHRDLKPHNILVGEFGETVVIDWGLAKDVTDTDTDTDDDGDGQAGSTTKRVDGSCGRHWDSDATTARLSMLANKVAGLGDGDLTRTGVAMGTAVYMAPEQADGAHAHVQCDVYALGAILYQMLTGRPPYADEQGITSIWRRVSGGGPTPLARLAPRAPSVLVAIVERAMARDRAVRHANAGQLAAELQRFQRGQLIPLYQNNPWQLASFFVRKYRAILTVAVTLLMALVVTGAIGVYQVTAEAERADRERAQAESSAVMAEEQRALAESNAAMAEKQSQHAREAEERAKSEATAARVAQTDAERALQRAEAAQQRAEAAIETAQKARAGAERAKRQAVLALQMQAEAREAADAARREAEVAAEKERHARAQAQALAEQNQVRLERALSTFGIAVRGLE